MENISLYHHYCITIIIVFFVTGITSFDPNNSDRATIITLSISECKPYKKQESCKKTPEIRIRFGPVSAYR